MTVGLAIMLYSVGVAVLWPTMKLWSIVWPLVAFVLIVELVEEDWKQKDSTHD